MNMMRFLLQTFAVIVAGLFLGIPVSQATEITVKSGINSVVISGFSYADYVDVQVNIVSPDQINIAVTPTTTQYEIKRLFFYPCKSRNPGECVDQVSPVVENGNFDRDFNWLNCELSDVCTTYYNFPQSGNFLVIAQVEQSDGKVFWSSLWYQISRIAYSSFNVNHYEIGNIEVNVIEGMMNDVRDYINEYKMIPFRDWIDPVKGIVFSGLSGLLKISSPAEDINSALFSTSSVTGSKILPTSINEDYNFISSDSGSFNGGMTLYLRPTFECGNSVCESELGETQSVCCYDCGCWAGKYCDGGIGGYCRSDELINLKLFSAPELQITDCTEGGTITVKVELENPPSEMVVQSFGYRLYMDGEVLADGVCPVPWTGENDVYTCVVNVPPVPGCEGSSFTLDPNYIDMSIRYSNGPSYLSKTKDMSVSFGSVSVGSYECGSRGCESGLGEDSYSCCYDCGCSEGYYCSTNQGNPSGGVCKSELTNYNFYALGWSFEPKPMNFYTHTTSGDTVKFVAQITNKPLWLNVRNPLCSMSCSECDSEGTCTSCSGSVQCDLSCVEADSMDSSVYNSSCQLTFRIAGYNAAMDYKMTPDISVVVDYYDANQMESVKLEDTLPDISIGGNYCGDGDCDDTLGETQENCCYDCGCGATEYCDTKYDTGPSSEDSCKPLNGIMLNLREVRGQIFTDSLKNHVINITGEFQNVPSGMQITDSGCIFGGGNENLNCISRFGTNCQWTQETDTSKEFTCNLTVQDFKYNRPDFLEKYGDIFEPYNANTDTPAELSVEDNSIWFDIEFSNGPSRETKKLEKVFSDFSIEVIPECGDLACNNGTDESRYCLEYDSNQNCIDYMEYINLGESYEGDLACCLESDCPCPSEDYYCNEYLDQPSCVDRSSFALNIETGSIECEVLPVSVHGSDERGLDYCYFGTNSGSIRLRIDNPPDGFSVESDDYANKPLISCIYPGEESDDFQFNPFCQSCEYDEEASTDTMLFFDCEMLVFGHIHDASEGEQDVPIEVKMTNIRYGGSLSVQPDLVTQGDITVTRIINENLKTKQEEKEELQDRYDKLKNIKVVIDSLVTLGAAFCVITFLVCVISCFWGCNACGFFGKWCPIVACLSSALYSVNSQIIDPWMINLQEQIAQLDLFIYGTYQDYQDSNRLTFYEVANIAGKITGLLQSIGCMIYTGVKSFQSPAVGASGATGSGGGGGGSSLPIWHPDWSCSPFCVV